MASQGSSFEEIKKIYDERRLRHSYELESRKKEVTARVPGFSEKEQAVIELSMQYGRSLIGCKQDKEKKEHLTREYHEKMLDIRMAKKKLLTEAGYPYDYLELTYDCDKCLDTGYVEGEKCQCRRQLEARYLYESSHIQEFLENNNFECMSRQFYTGDDLENFDKAVSTCRNFINNFNSDYRNLLFYGTVGTGKSFLSGCVAKELMDRGCQVIYFSATQLFQTISNHVYDRDKEIFNELLSTIYECDLLIIDDLGTEVINDFIRSQFFNIINERALRQKSVIISTNLTLEMVREKYSDRVFSRIYESFEFIKLSVYKDIRLQKRLAFSEM